MTHQLFSMLLNIKKERVFLRIRGHHELKMFFRNLGKNEKLVTIGRGILFILVLFIFLFVHLFKLTEVPFGLNVDEAAAAYDGLCLAQYGGVDRFLNPYPVYFVNWGDGQNAMYTYLNFLFFRCFGISKWTIRLGIVLASFWAALCGYLLIRKTESKDKALLWFALYTVIPIFIMAQRFGLESHLMLAGSSAILFFVWIAVSADVQSPKVMLWYAVAGIICGSVLYTYALSYIVIPVFLLLIIPWLIRIKKFRLRNLLAFGVPLAVIATPLLLLVYINAFGLDTMHIGPITIPKLVNYRGSEFSLSLKNLMISFWDIIRCTLLYDECTYNTSATFGAMYYCSIPFAIVGLVTCFKAAIDSFKKRELRVEYLVMAWFIGELIMGITLTRPSNPNSTRMIGIYIPMLYFIYKGIILICSITKSTVWRRRIQFGIGVFYICSFALFVKFYFTEFNDKAFPMRWLFYETYDDVHAYMEEHSEEDWASYSTMYPWQYIYYVLEHKVDPHTVAINVRNNPDYPVGLEWYEGNHIDGELSYGRNLLMNVVRYKTETNEMDYCKALGYTFVEAGDGMYIGFTPFSNYVVQESSNTFYHLDSCMEVANDEAELIGWAYSGDNLQAFDDIYLVADGVRYDAVLYERNDVATAFGLEMVDNLGFKIVIPSDLFSETKKINLCGYSDGEILQLQSYDRK